jgi:hypothetical protein
MKELTNIYKETGQQFVDDLFKDYLLVTEKLSGSSFSFERHGDDIRFFKGSNKQPINLVDRTLMMYYEQAIQYILTKTEGHIKDLPEHWRFCFQYFVNNQPGVIRYDNLPTNNLLLTHIQVRNAKGKIAKVIEDPRVLRDWADAFEVTPLIPIFSGYLKEAQKKKIREFLSTPKEDHLEVFGTSSFAKYLIDALNPTIKQTTLQNNLNKPIDSIIFKFFKQGTNQIFTAKMIDPYTQGLMKDKEPIDLRRVPADINEILLLDILAFIEERGLRGGELLTATSQERYLELMSNLFNDYIAKRGVDLQKLDIEKAKFAKGPEFNLNLDLIKNRRTKEILQKSESLQNLYKIMVGSLRKKRNPERVGSVMTKSVVEDFNKMVDKITDAINKETDGEFKTFGDYLNNKVSEAVDYKDLEELVVEEKVLNYNKFINLGKVVIEANAEDQKFKNPETGRQVKVSSALGYDKNSPAYKKAKEIIGDKEPSEKEPTEKTEDFDISKIDKKKAKNAFNLVEKIEKIKDPKQRKEAEKVAKALNDYEIAETDADKKKAIENLIKDAGINRNATGTKTNKIYLGQPTDADGDGINKLTGLSDKGTIGGDKGKFQENLLDEAERLGVEFPLNASAKRMSGASVAPNAIHVDENGKPAKPTKIATTEIKGKGKPGDDDYEAPGVQLGGKGGLIIKETLPLTDKEKTDLKEKFKKADPSRTDADVNRLMSINVEFRKQNNNKLKAIRSGELTIAPIIRKDGTEVDLFTDKGKKEAVGIVTKNMTDRIDNLLSNPPGYKKSPQLQKSLNNYKNAGDDFSNGKISKEEFIKAGDDLLIELKNDPQGTYGGPFLQETLLMAEGLANGRSVVSPSSANFKVADLITFDSAELPADATPEQINEYVQLMSVSGGATSIKEGKGGASSSAAKIEGTTYADYTDKDGKVVNGEEVKKDLTELTEDGYNKIWNSPEAPDKDGNFLTLEKSMEDGLKLAEKYGVSDVLEERGLVKGSKKYDAQMKKYEKRAKPIRVNGVKEKYAKMKPPIELTDEQAKELLIKRFHARDINGYLMAEINNKQQMAQSFTNISRDVEPTESGSLSLMSEEEAKKDSNIVKDAKGNPIVVLNPDGTPETNKAGTEKRYRRKEKVVREETNGIDSLACMSYQSTPDFTDTGRPTNKNAAFVKKCSGKNKHIGDS